MERITRREEGEAFWNGKDYCKNAQDLCENCGCDCLTCPLGTVLERLCQYEDTGIEPEMISVLANRYIAEQGRKKKNSRNRRKTVGKRRPTYPDDDRSRKEGVICTSLLRNTLY